jgi:glycosyltransferase involved in cell wall biosynthesis
MNDSVDASINFTVAIPTYNGEQRLPDVLELLRSQVISTAIAWEVIVVDNNSSDNTAQVVQAFQPNFPVPLRYCFEAQQGLAHARHCAIEAAQSDLVGFLDDDNLPEANWVEAAFQFAQAHPRAAAIGSRINADLAVAPPDHFEHISAFLALTQRGSKPLLYSPQRRLLPPGAGLVVRKSVWLRVVPKHLVLCGRVNGNMLAGEDLEALSYIQQSGWDVWYNPEMVIRHKIPATRLTEAYLIPFFRGIGLSRFVTRTAGFSWKKQLFLFLAYLLNDLKKLLLYLVKHKLQIKRDLVTACHWELLWSSFISPFYLWYHGYFHKPDRRSLPSSIPSKFVQSVSVQPVHDEASKSDLTPTPDLTIVLPTFNGADRLPSVLEKLRSQIVKPGICWEIIVVDNNSTDSTAEVVRRYQADRSFPVSIKYVLELSQGPAFARQAGVQLANSELIGFLDDDNLADENWVQAACSFAADHPQAGAFASQIQGKFAVEPDVAIKPILFYLAITQRGEQPLQYQPNQNGLPPSAGLVVRRTAWLKAVPKVLRLVGRVGQSMLSGEDAEALTYIHRCGWQIWYNPEMKIEHVIGAARLEREYLIRLLQGVGLARYHLRMLLLARWQRPFFLVMYLVSDLQKAIAFYLKHRAVLSTNTVAACEMERLLSTLISPFYLFQQSLFRITS